MSQARKETEEKHGFIPFLFLDCIALFLKIHAFPEIELNETLIYSRTFLSSLTTLLAHYLTGSRPNGIYLPYLLTFP